jgi:hypothetical protein
LYFLLKRKRKEIIVATIGRKAEHLASVYESVRNKKNICILKIYFVILILKIIRKF